MAVNVTHLCYLNKVPLRFQCHRKVYRLILKLTVEGIHFYLDILACVGYI